MQWCVEVPYSSSPSPSSYPNHRRVRPTSFLITMTLILNIIHLPSSVQTSSVSACSPYLVSTHVDPRTKNQYVSPCPVSTPCQCVCEPDSQRLWIDCFHRQLKSFPQFQSIPTNNTLLEWNVDLGFNLFDNLTTTNQSHWLPNNMHVRYMVLSSSLAYDLIVQLNLTHRHLVDLWPSQAHLPIIDDHFQPLENFDRDDSDDEVGNAPAPKSE